MPAPRTLIAQALCTRTDHGRGGGGLLDLNMPRMGGIEFLRALRADPALRPLSVIVLTTSDEDRDKVEAY